MDFQKFFPSIFLTLTLIFQSSCKPKTETPAATPSPVTPITSGGAIHISGILTYDYVSAASGKLDYAGVTQRPMRNVYVELLNAGNDAVVSSTSTDDNGAYDFSIANGGNIKLRIYAEMKTPSVIIQDNTNSNAEYALVSPAYPITVSTVKNIRAVSGWSGTNAGGSYSLSRQAAPFAMLDSVYTITKKIKAVRPAISFPPLKINWSVDNVGVDGDVSIGQITTSHFNTGNNQMYILGKADVDTDEYDNHVIVHEWGHFLENNISRADSIGGSHGTGDEKEMSLAFGEGWGNALSAMALDPDAVYADTGGARQQSGFRINIESSTDSNKGWFSETSIQEILYDIYDTTNEAGDNLSLGLGPIMDVLTGYQKTTTATTSIFSFIYGLKTLDGSLSNDLNTLLATKNIVAVTDPYGTGETNNGGWASNLPVYHSLTLGGGAVSLSLYGNSGASDFYGLYNTVFNNKYVKFTASSSTTRLTVTSTDTFELDVYKKGVEVASKYQPRTSSGVFGPFVYDIPTTNGQEYSIEVLTAQEVIFANSIVNLTITGTAQ